MRTRETVALESIDSLHSEIGLQRVFPVVPRVVRNNRESSLMSSSCIVSFASKHGPDKEDLSTRLHRRLRRYEANFAIPANAR